MLQNLFGKSNTKHGFKWIEVWRNETRNQFSVVLKEIQTNEFSGRNFTHNTVIENLVEFPSNTLIHPFDSGFPENNKLIHEKKNEIFLISLTCVDGNTMNQTVSIISAADIVLDSVRNSLLIPYISSYRNHKTTINELEQVFTLRADDLGISIPSVAINKEKESVNESDYSSENSRDSFSSEETHDSLEIPADHTDDHFKLYEEKNTNPLENSDLIIKPFCEPKPIFALPIDTQQIIGDKSVDNDTQDNAASRKFISVPTEACDSGKKTCPRISSNPSTPKHKRNRSIKRYIYSSQDSGQSDPKLIADTDLSSPSPINPQPLKRNKRAASSPLHPLIRSNIGAPVNNINSESGKIWDNAEIISHESHDKKPLNHGKDSHGNSREPLLTDNNHNNETLTSLNDIDNKNNKLIHEKKNEIFLISLTCVDGNTMNQTVSIISAADIVLDSVRNSLLIPYISSYRNHKTTINELEQVFTLRADDLGISIPSVAINKEKESVNESDYSSENSRDSFSSEETHDSLEIPADHTDDHFKLYEEKNTNPLENSDLIIKPFCEPKPIFALPIDTQQIIGDKSVDNDTQDNAASRKFISVPTEACDSGKKTCPRISSNPSTPKHKRNRSIKRYIYSSQDSGQSDPKLIADTDLSSPSPINPQPLKRNKRAASSPLHPLIRSNIGAPVNNINSESGKIWDNAEIISHESHDKKPLNHGKDSHGNSREPLLTDNNHNNETLTSLNDIDNSNNINNNLPDSNILELGEAVIPDKEDYTYMSIGQSSPLFLPKENIKEPFSSFTFNQDYPFKEEIYNELETFSNTLSSPDLFASYIINLQYIEPPVQITPLFIFDKFLKNDRNVFRNLKSSYRNYLQYHRKSSFLQQYDAAIHKIFSMYRNKQSVIDIPGEKEEELISGLHLHYVWEYLIKLVLPTGYSPKYNNQIKFIITILKILNEQLDLENVFSILQQKYLESKPPLNSHLEGLVRILRRNLNRFSSIQYKELDIIDETVKQYQAGKRVNNIFNKSSSFDKSKVYQDKGKHTVDDSVKSQMEGISYDTSTTQQSSHSENFDLFKDNIPSYPCIDKSVVEEDTLTQQLKQFMNSMHNVETFVDYILKLKDIKFPKLSLPKSIQSFLLSGKSFFKSFRSFNKPEHQISFESSLNEAINNYIQTTGSSSCSKIVKLTGLNFPN
ncbi:hypothetical protein Glove_95g51 [Diversispora epigaea]|uniref:Uncharacterized protein n=1 Tax=Diversispora epigaea TaxID=1348612 RepID=A0A397J5N7_9GLOM|nr:hypothetical protein Glove_95g51 [Diversispora epigaea]